MSWLHCRKRFHKSGWWSSPDGKIAGAQVTGEGQPMTGRQPPPDPTGGRPVVPTTSALRPLGLGEVRLNGGFWAQRQETNASATLDHARSWMDKLGWAGNFTAGHEAEMSP